MSERYPQLRYHKVIEGERLLCLRESVSICFYMRHDHADVAQAVVRSLETYLRAVGAQSLGWYPDYDGEWQELDERGWALQWEELRDPRGAQLDLRETAGPTTGYAFTYRGCSLDAPLVANNPDAVCMLSFLLPTEYLEAHGPGHVRELALELAAGLPFNSGHAGLVFQYCTGSALGTNELVRKLCFRYPGMDIPSWDTLEWRIGTRVRGVHWLTFLGQPVLGALGGATGLRARLHAPGTTVQELEGERAVVTLGKGPDAGDLEQGRTLPQYRELARVLEPWLYEDQREWTGFTPEDLRRWNRRFLD
jgi:hypothetical protein